MKTKTKASPTQEELSGYIDIVPYQQKGDPCYGGDTGETEYEDYGFATADELLLNLGVGEYYDYVLGRKVYEYLATCVTIVENEPISILSDEYYEMEDEEELDEEEAEGGDIVVIDGDEEVFEGEDIEEDYVEEDPTEELILQTE